MLTQEFDPAPRKHGGGGFRPGGADSDPRQVRRGRPGQWGGSAQVGKSETS